MFRRSNSIETITLLVFACLFALGALHIVGCSQEKQSPPKPTVRTTPTTTAVEEKPKVDLHNTIAVLETSKGTIEIEFFADDAPKTIENFLKNVRLEYYKNGEFHRVEPGRIIQAQARFAIEETIPIEKGEQQPVKGVVAMAKAQGATVSDAAQFFICLDTVELDSDYTLFGKVVKGLDVIDKIEVGDKIISATTRDKG